MALGGHLYTDDAECADDSDCPTGRFCDIRDLGYGTPGICVLTDYCTDVSPEAVGGTGAYGYVSGWNVDSDFEFSYELDYYVLPEDQADGCGFVDLANDLNFTFPFYGQTHSGVWACIEGFLDFGASDPMLDETPDCPIVDRGTPRILAFHADLDFYYDRRSVQGHHVNTIHYQRESDCVSPSDHSTLVDCVHFNWNYIQVCAHPDSDCKRGHHDGRDYDIDITLYADGEIGMIVSPLGEDALYDWADPDYSVGLTSGDGDVLQILCNEVPPIRGILWSYFIYPRFDIRGRDCEIFSVLSSSAPASTSTDGTLVVDVQFSQNPGSVFPSDFTVNGGGAVVTSVSGSGTSYSVTVSLDAALLPDTVNVQIVAHAAFAASDNTLARDVYLVTGTLEFEREIYFSSPISGVLTFSEDVDLEASDVQGAQVNAVSTLARSVDSSHVYRVSVTPDCDGAVTVTVPLAATSPWNAAVSARFNYAACLVQVISGGLRT